LTRTLHHRTGALFTLLFTLLLTISLTGIAHAAAPDHRDEYALGRYSDTNSWGDFSSPLTQSLAILALHRDADSDPPPTAIDLLLAQQCEDGGFPDTFRSPSTRDPSPCTGGVDTTAFAVQALAAVGQSDAVAAATSWLVAVQDEDDGSFGAQDGVNSNSTGLAALALDLGGRPGAAEDARTWVRGIQDGCDADTPGAIPFNDEERGAPELSTAQAILGLVDPGVGLADLDATAASGEPDTGCGSELDDAVEAAAAFLVSLLDEDPYVPFPGFDSPNVGGTIDILFALAAAGTGDQKITDVLDWLGGQAEGYTQDGEGGAGAGATAKLALAFLIDDQDPQVATGIDLIAQLESLEVTELADVTINCDVDEVTPGDEVECTITGLLGGETVDVLVELNPTLFEGTATADSSGTATLAFSVPEDAPEDGVVTITVDGLGVDGLADLALPISTPESGEPIEDPEEVEEEVETVEGEEEEGDILPETGGDASLVAGIGAAALLLGLGLVAVTRRRRELSQG
jgi:LPXTG-motif cell wall-anchored protein